jgi:hypothetical protein
MHCDCQGRQHVVCRELAPPITLTPCHCGGRSGNNGEKHFHHVSLHSTPVRPRTWDCGCHGRAHPVCDPTWKRVKDAPAAIKPIRFPTLKQALREGLTLRPHVEHVFTCNCDEYSARAHRHHCLCGFTLPYGRAIGRGMTLRIPVEQEEAA